MGRLQQLPSGHAATGGLIRKGQVVDADLSCFPIIFFLPFYIQFGIFKDTHGIF